jgi:D-3-phosphoglycerate dehydrogenase / 2-oxoglutarate reductase
MKKKILIVQPIHESGVQVFDNRFEVCVASDTSVATVIKEIKGAEGVIVRMAPFTREIIEAADALKVIGRHGVGVDTIDVKAATERGIIVVNTPNANAISVAEHTLIAIGSLAKQMTVYNREIRAGQWEIRNSYRAIDLDGKILGLVGIGRIGSLVARKAAAAFNMKVIAFDPYVAPEKAREMGIALVAVSDDVFRQADVVSLHTPLTPETRRFVNASRLRLMKRSAFLINFSRGEVVDEKGLYEALKTGVIAGAAIDVYDPEPPLKDNPLYELDNIILSPHSAALTQECVIRMATGAAEGVVDVLSGRRPQFVINPEVFNK